MIKVCEDVVGPISILANSVKPPLAASGVHSVLVVDGNPSRFRLELSNVGAGSAFLNADDTPTDTGFKLLNLEPSTSGHARSSGGSLSLTGPAASAAVYAISEFGGAFAEISVLEFIEGEPA